MFDVSKAYLNDESEGASSGKKLIGGSCLCRFCSFQISSLIGANNAEQSFKDLVVAIISKLFATAAISKKIKRSSNGRETLQLGKNLRLTE